MEDEKKGPGCSTWSLGQSTATSTQVDLDDWSSPDDPENPYNWSFGKKVYHASIIAAYAFTSTFMSSIYSSGTDEVAEHFGVSTTVSLLGLSLYSLGLSFGPVLAAPLSETFGRSIIYRVTLPVSAFFTIGSAVAQNMATIVICRFFAGFFAAPALSIGGGTTADIFKPSSRGIAMSFFLLAPCLGPAVGPVIGGFVVEKKGFRWLGWVMVFFIFATYTYSLWLSETYKPILLEKRRRQLGRAEAPKPTDGPGAMRTFVTVTLLRPLKMLITEPIVACFGLYVSVDFGILYTFFAAFPLVYTRVYGFNSGEIGLAFVPIFIGCLLATATCILCDRLFYQKQLAKVNAVKDLDNSLRIDEESFFHLDQPSQTTKHVEPEHRLYCAMIGGVGLPIGLFWFAWTARTGVSWASSMVGTMIFAWGNLCVFVAAMMYLVDSYGPQYGASAVSSNVFCRYIFAAAFPLFAIQMYDRLGAAWATSLLGFISVALLPIPWILFVWGPKIRQKSAYIITEH